MKKEKLFRITTVPISLQILLKNQLGFMNQYYDVVGISAGPKVELQKVAQHEGILVEEVNMTRKITPFQDLKSIYSLYKTIKKQKPKIVHTHTPKAGLVGMIAAWLANVPIRMHTVAGLPLLEATGFKRKILNTVEKTTYRFATHVYPNSKGLYDIILENNFCKTNKLKVLANGSTNGIDTAYFSRNHFSENQLNQLKSEYNITKNDFTFIFVGRLVKDKGINELVAAFDKLSKEEQNIKLLLVGNYEPELDPLEKETLNIISANKNIISAGFQKDVRPFFAISNTLVFPSYREGFPNVVMQAASMNLPCIVSNINGCNEIILQNLNGLIIPIKNEIAIFEAMKTLLYDKDFYAKLQAQARKSIVERYEQKYVWEQILNEYKQLEKSV